MPDELKALMEEPLSQDELDSISGFMHELPRPEKFYYTEAWRADRRFESNCPWPRPLMFQRLNGSRREGVIVRHLVKRRWEKLGVWNSQWGFAGRKIQPGDDFHRWTWWWEPEGAADDCGRKYREGRELVARALRLRQNLRRGEHAPVIRRSHLGPDATAAEAEAFLISRPWFIFQIEVAEEKTSGGRSAGTGDEFNRSNNVTSWKWRHESPSLEPEDLAPLNNMKDSPLDAAEEMEFTPSEIDELETIDLPRSEQPKGFWVVEKGDFSSISFPGEMVDQMADAEESLNERNEMLEKLKAEGKKPPMSAGVKFFIDKFFPNGAPIRLFGSPPPEEREESKKLEEDASEPQESSARSPPQRQRRSRQSQPRDG
ncbi:hypothetical protein NKR23_g12365 [Pleurostoma richardsiae]|uniref:Uncharacterized protein n=1 Tax=Pleurostoma richardsiae TaxID=41990 RepID=A0AA38VFL0_9PEZI|nr:hypothetical protein NKR23_g12365 [Pleurostoma richardsiae]